MASIELGVEAFNAFLQANVTGPILTKSQTQLAQPYADKIDLRIASLDVDGVSVYSFIPHIDLFCLAKHVIENIATPESWAASNGTTTRGISLAWMRLRLLVWHYKLFILPSLSGSAFTKHAGMTEVPSLVERIQDALATVETDVVSDAWELAGGRSKWTTEEQVRFLLEKANVCIMLGRDAAAREALERATDVHGFSYALSGALGKRTKFQEKSTSQLVVLAKSRADVEAEMEAEEEQMPEALLLDDDTLLEEIKYGGEGLHGEADVGVKSLPPALRALKPDEQPPLNPLDQIILLTEATLKDAFSPVDTLTSEEVLPFAVRVIGEKEANWQIYTQALLVRSRIEMHRSRTVERGVLQMQAVVDQVVVDTTTKVEDAPIKVEKPDVPVIAVSLHDEAPKKKRDREEAAPVQDKAISFFPVAKSTEMASASTRLEYLHALSSPPRWHLESELAYAWTGVGSLISALEIFKRLKLWAEVALCLASSASTDNDDGSGRGGGGEEKARAIIRWRLFHRNAEAGDDQAGDEIDEDTDISRLKAAEFTGPERTPPQPNAPRLFCILGDIESESAVAHYERAWEISKHRYARAQKSLAEHYLVQKDWVKAREAYRLAVSVNRLSPEMWSRLGDINLRLGEFAEAAESFTRAIGSSNDTAGGEDARTWSNLGSALYSMYQEAIEKEKKDAKNNGDAEPPAADSIKASDEEDEEASTTTESTKAPSVLLAQAMNAYKRGASVAHDNWRIWDNVITLAARMRPLPFFEIIQALRAIIRIRQTEDALDDDILRLLLLEGVISKEIAVGEGVYEPPRGSVERNMNEMLENDIVPLITHRSELWELLSRLRVWRRDLAGAVEASEKAWRAAMGGAGAGGLSVDDAKKDEAAASRNWLEKEAAWKVVVQRTDELVAVLETYGPQVPEIGDKWRVKARSAVRSVMGKGKEPWEGSEDWETLKALLEGLKV